MSEDWFGRLDREVDAIAGVIVGLRRHLHMHPEPSREEFATARHLSSLLAETGIAHRLIPSGRGVIAGGGPGAAVVRVALRADTDALPIDDAKDVAYRSLRPGVMHACGHDAHTAMVMGAALALQRAADVMPAGIAWKAIFQPAEEVAEGALEMIEHGALDGVDAILALHVEPGLEVGCVGVKEGVLTACCQNFEVRVTGRGGHAARPHLGADPIAAASQFVTTVFQAIPRSVDAREPVVVSFGSIAGGSSANVIPDRVKLLGTIRTLGAAEAARVRERLSDVSRGVGLACGVEISLEFGPATDAVRNDPGVTAALMRTSTDLLGLGGVVTIPLPSMGSEDFAAYTSRVPGCMIRLGVGSGPSPRPALHNPYFDIDERALTIGAKLLARGVVGVAQTILGNREIPPQSRPRAVSATT